MLNKNSMNVASAEQQAKMRKRAEKKKLKQRKSRSELKALPDAVQQFFGRIQNGVKPLQEFPAEIQTIETEVQCSSDVPRMTIKISRPPETYEVTMEAHLKEGLLHVDSPITGLQKYQYNSSSKEWEHEVDGHVLSGILTRDLMRWCSGIPEI